MNLFDDRLGLLGTLAGAFLVLAGLGTLVGMPWQYSGGGAGVAVGQILGAIATVAVGAGLVWLVRSNPA
ncbi:hypothetical protein ACFQH6_01995 [Halobacteriaceae archaeon GCM10025711]